jgi:hypothetical protein
MKGESKASTKTAKAWLDIGPGNVRQWTDDKLVEFLEQADEVVVNRNGNKVKLLDIVNEGKAGPDLQIFLNGTAAGKSALEDPRVKAETDVETLLVRYVWTPLEQILGRKGAPDRFPITSYTWAHVSSGGGRASTSPFVPMPQQYARLYTNDRVIEFQYEESGLDFLSLGVTLPTLLDESNSTHQQIAKKCSRVMVEIKPDALCPKRKLVSDDQMEEKNAAYGGNLFDYMQSPHFDPEFNPVAQVVTYALASRTKCVMIHTMNHMTLGLIDVSDPAKPMTLVSKKFDCSSPFPFRSSVPPTHRAASWSLWDVMLRFILASTKHWYLDRFPDDLKRKFKEKLDLSKRSRKRSEVGQDVLADTEPEESDGNTGSNVSDQKSTEKTSRDDTYILKPFCYAELWDPLRFAIPATHSIEDESTEEKLEGDATLIGEGRMGPVYRQTIQGRDVAVKLLVFCAKRSVDDCYTYPDYLRDEMAREVDVYNRLRHLQGKTIPTLLWYGEFISGMADALATEYFGERLPELRSREQIANAMKALHSLHENGVLHGDVSLRNFVCKGNHMCILDFGFSKFREELSETDWKEGVKKEKTLLKKELESRKRVHELR